MTLRAKLLLAQAPLALALIAVGALAAWGISALDRSSRLILKSNYGSVVAAQQMKEAIQRIDAGIRPAIDGRNNPSPGQIDRNLVRFETEMRVQEGNISEPDELEATTHLRELWENYQAELDRFQQIADAQAAEHYYASEMQAELEAVNAAADRVLAINQQAMQEKSRAAEHLASWAKSALLVCAAGALAVGVLLSVALTNRMLRPLSVLTQAVDRVGQGDFQARAAVSGRDEIARLTERFNLLTEHLRDYRNSSLGQLMLARNALQAAIDSIPDPVIVFGSDGQVQIVNDAAESLLQNDSCAAQPEPGDLLPATSPELRIALEEAREHVLQGQGVYLPKGFEDSLAVTTADGDRWFLLRATPVCEDRGQISGATVMLQDVTRLRRFDELKNDLVATVAHEFRTPLTSLRMAIHLCLEGTAGPVSDKQVELLRTAGEDCTRLQHTVDELLDLARIQSGNIRLNLIPVTASELAKTALEAHRARAADKPVALDSGVDVRRLHVLADPERIQLVFSNLLANAIRHTPAGGAVQVQFVPESDRVRFEVTDTGEGIAPEHQAAVFEKFFRVPGTESGSAGLGLSLSKEIVEAHQGQVGVRSVPGQGSTFWFTLPTAPTD